MDGARTTPPGTMGSAGSGGTPLLGTEDCQGSVECGAVLGVLVMCIVISSSISLVMCVAIPFSIESQNN